VIRISDRKIFLSKSMGSGATSPPFLGGRREQNCGLSQPATPDKRKSPIQVNVTQITVVPAALRAKIQTEAVPMLLLTAYFLN